jgi:hypothetical protein
VDYAEDGSVSAEQRLTTLVEHDTKLAQLLPEPFLSDYLGRYRADEAMSADELRGRLGVLFKDRPTLVAAVPSFDAGHLKRLLGHAPWHYQLRCVETLTAGRLGRECGGLAKCLEALGLEPNPAAHTAEGDAEAAYRIWKHLMD